MVQMAFYSGSSSLVVFMCMLQLNVPLFIIVPPVKIMTLFQIESPEFDYYFYKMDHRLKFGLSGVDIVVVMNQI